MNKKVIILGSSRSDGNTKKIIDYINKNNQFDIIDLNTKKIGYFDYDFANDNDDFIPMMEEIVDKYDEIVFATPVYWYTMSAQLKTFFDRISDLLKKYKPLGRKLRGKTMSAISCAGSEWLIDGFFTPFTATAEYLGMKYRKNVHTWVVDDQIPSEVIQRLEEFLEENEEVLDENL